MEKYKYKFYDNQHKLLVVIQAEHLNEAIVKAGFNGYHVQYAYPAFAVIMGQSGSIGVKWEEIKLPEIPPINSNELTAEEQNLIKDILKYIGNHTGMTTEFAREILGRNSGVVARFNKLADSIFGKLQNGRLTVEIK